MQRLLRHPRLGRRRSRRPTEGRRTTSRTTRPRRCCNFLAVLGPCGWERERHSGRSSRRRARRESPAVWSEVGVGAGTKGGTRPGWTDDAWVCSTSWRPRIRDTVPSAPSAPSAPESGWPRRGRADRVRLCEGDVRGGRRYGRRRILPRVGGPLCGYLVARRGGGVRAVCARRWRCGARAFNLWRGRARRRSSIPDFGGSAVSCGDGGGDRRKLRRRAGGASQTERRRVARRRETLVTYAIESASGSGRTLLSWLADTMPRNPRGIDACRSLFFSALNREDVARATSADDEISADAPVAARTFASWFSDDVRRARSSGRVSSTRMGGLRTRWSGRCGSRSVGGRRRPERWRFAASRGTRAFDSPVGVPSPIASGFRSMSSDATSPRTSRFCTRTLAASTAPGASGSCPTRGAWRGTCTT